MTDTFNEGESQKDEVPDVLDVTGDTEPICESDAHLPPVRSYNLSANHSVKGCLFNLI